MEERYQHCIFVASNYTSGKRKGLHFLYNSANIKVVLERASEYAGVAGVSVYFITSNEATIESVQEKDEFFKNIEIVEGALPRNVKSFNDSIKNQISIIDIALLLLSQDKMTISDMKTNIFYCYYFYTKENKRFPFSSKCYIDSDSFYFKDLDTKFNNPKIDINKTIIKSSDKINVIMSKFFNCDGGVELMNVILKIYYQIKQFDKKELNDKIKLFISNYHNTKVNRNKTFNKKYNAFLTKKDIERIKIEL